MKANRWIHLVNSAGFIWKPSEFFLTILSGILKSVICWEAVVAWDGCSGSFEQGVLPCCGCLPIRCVYLPILLPPLPFLQDQFSYWRSELDFFQLQCHENCQLSLNHGAITGSEYEGKRRNPACFSDDRLIAEAHFDYSWGGERRGRRRFGEQKHHIFFN